MFGRRRIIDEREIDRKISYNIESRLGGGGGGGEDGEEVDITCLCRRWRGEAGGEV